MPKKKETTAGNGAPKRKTLYKETSTNLCQGKEALTCAQAKELLGWEEESDKIKFGDSYVREIYAMYGKKVRCLSNVTNRPIYTSGVAILIQEILRNRWRFNGEPIIIGKTGLVLNGQHTLVSLVLAANEWQNENDRWKPYWTKEPTIDKLVVFGVSEDDDVVNTMDTCKPRSLADVIYRSEYFAHLSFTDRRVAARNTDYGIRVLWHRTGAGLDAFAPRRTHAESLDFLDRHPKLLEAVRHIQEKDGKERRIGRYVAPGHAAALLYLMGSSTTEPEEYRGDPREDHLDWTNWDRATEFWVLLAAGSPDTDVVRQALGHILDDGGGSASERWALVIKAWNVFVRGKKIKTEDLELSYLTDQDDVRHLDECPVTGGIDLGNPNLADEETIVADDPDEDEIQTRAKKVRAKKAKLEPKKAGKKWAQGDVAWVNAADDDDHYVAKITGEIYETDDGQLRAMVTDAGTAEWDVAISDLYLLEPARKTEAVPSKIPEPKKAKPEKKSKTPEKDPGGPFKLNQLVWVCDDGESWRGRIVEMIGRNAKLKVEQGFRGAGGMRAATVASLRVRQPQPD